VTPVRVFDPQDLRQESTRISVFSDADLRRAITSVATRNLRMHAASTGGDGGGFGCEIVICAPLTPAAPYAIVPGCDGLRITSAGRIPIIPAAFISTLFVVRARAVTIDGLLVEKKDTTKYVKTFVGVGSENARNLVLARNVVNADQFLVDTSGVAGSFKILANQHQTVTASGLNLIDSGAVFGVIAENTFAASDARIGVKLQATAKACRIVGNHFFGGSVASSIDTSASIGNNRLAANSGTSTKTLAATDIDDDAWTGRLLRSPQIITSGSGTFTPAAGTNRLVVELVGGGGGGGGCTSSASNAACGAGGASGAYASRSYDLTGFVGTFTYAVGAAGAAGANTGGTGGTGGDTTFTDGTTLVTAKGGIGGIGQVFGTAAAFVAGGAGQLATNGEINGAGSPGEYAQRLSGTAGVSGGGGSSPWGGGGLALLAGGAGSAGKGIGAGGGGALVLNGSAAAIGGAGTAGAIRIWEFS
jgi:hypothetical protein